MDREELKEWLPFLIAYANGAKLQHSVDGKWKDYEYDDIYTAMEDFIQNWRIKPDEKGHCDTKD